MSYFKKIIQSCQFSVAVKIIVQIFCYGDQISETYTLSLWLSKHWSCRLVQNINRVLLINFSCRSHRQGHKMWNIVAIRWGYRMFLLKTALIYDDAFHIFKMGNEMWTSVLQISHCCICWLWQKLKPPSICKYRCV
jgi:hypothetical protein